MNYGNHCIVPVLSFRAQSRNLFCRGIRFLHSTRYARCSRNDTKEDSLKSRCLQTQALALVEAEHQVHVVHSLTLRTLQKIVDCTGNQKFIFIFYK